MLQDPFPSDNHLASHKLHPVEIQVMYSRDPKGKLAPGAGAQSHKRL